MQNQPISLQNVSSAPGEGGVVTLSIQVASSAVAEARSRVIKDFSKRIRVPGFRPGSIPAGIVRRNVGDEAITQEIADQIVPAAYQAALDQENIQPLERAEVDNVEFDAFDGDKPFTFDARVIVRPLIALGSLEGLTATKRNPQITDEDVNQAIEQMRQEAAYLEKCADASGRNGRRFVCRSAGLRGRPTQKRRTGQPARFRRGRERVRPRD